MLKGADQAPFLQLLPVYVLSTGDLMKSIEFS